MQTSKRIIGGIGLLFALFATIAIIGCAGVRARKTAVTSFVFYAVDNPALERDVAAGVNWRAGDIRAVVPPGTDVRSLVATLDIADNARLFVKEPSGNRVKQVNGETPNDYSKPLTYLLVLEDGTEVEFVVTLREAETNAAVASLQLEDEVVLTPAFSQDQRSYTAAAPFEVAELRVRVTTESQYATVTIAGRQYSGRGAAASVALAVGEVTSIAIVATAEDGVNTESYELNVERAEPDHDATMADIAVSEYASLTPAFSNEVGTYEVIIDYKEAGVAITPAAQSPVATVTVNGKPVASGEPSEMFALVEGETKTVTVVATAQDGVTKQEYVFNLIRKPIDPTFSLASADPGFSERFGFEAVVFKGRLWVIGGSATNMDYMNDIWYSEDGESWTRATMNPGFAPRRNHQVVVFQDRMWLLGGEIGSYEYTNDVWVSEDGAYWVKLDVAAPFPERINHQAVVFKGKMWVVGGYGSTSTGHSVWSSMDGVTWTEEIHEAAFPPRDMHQLLAFQDQLWIIGGKRGSDRFADIWASPDGLTWTQITDNPGFNPRMLHQAAVFADRIWVNGGYGDGYTTAQDIWYSTDGKSWEQATDAADFGGRVAHQMVVFQDRLWVIGGISGTASRRDVWRSNAVQ